MNETSFSTLLHPCASVMGIGEWQKPATVQQLLRPLPAVKFEASCQNLLDRFLLDTEAGALPVVDDHQRPVTLIERTTFIEFFSHGFRRDVFGRRSIADLLSCRQFTRSDPLVIETRCTVEDAAQLVIGAGMQHMVTGFIISREGRYAGVADGRDLLNIITRRKQAELYFLAHYDALTGLPNRGLLSNRLEHACRDADRRGSLVALLFIDVDRFKQINDSLGHSAGDEVLRKITTRLKAAARQVDTVARLAGDEFVILLEGLSDPQQVAQVADRIVRSMTEPIDLLGHTLVVTVSIGSAIYPHDADIHSLLARADAAMYEAKAAGRNGFRSYARGMKTYSPAGMALEHELRKAIEQGKLLLDFQPQLDLESGAMIGVEALVRWRHPEKGMIPPLEFISVAEECGLIVPLGEWVVRTALAQLRAWLDRGLAPVPVSVNISALHFQQQGFPRFLSRQLAEHRIEPGLLELELTESVLMHNVDEVLETLNEIKSFGVRLAIDDFGTGFSSLSYLRRFPIDRLKIDQSFVRDIETSPVNESIAGAIVALANSLSLEIVAEGIERDAEAEVLRRLKCPQGQGYLFSRPLDAERFVDWLAERTPALTASAELPT